jgi:ZIP family zinc transporter
MSEVLILFLAACGTALATGLGAIPVFLLGSRAAGLAPSLLGFAAGVMGVAAVAGLLIPATQEGSATEVVVGLAVGVGFLALVRWRVHPDASFMGRSGPGTRTSALVFLVLFVHSLPEGFAIGSAFASSQAGLSAFVIAAIAIQNVPEGTATAAAMQPAGYGPWKQFWGAVLTSVPQVPGALIAWLAVERIDGLLPASFALAGGAMLALVVVDLLPDAWKHAAHVRVVVGTVLGAVLMLAVGAALEV